MDELSFATLKNVKSDVEDLLKAFEGKNSLRFSHFCEVWKEAKFSLIFCGRNSIGEMMELVDEIFHITKEYLLPAYEFPIRIGALYTLYGLYFKQPMKTPIKIRLIKSEWDGLCKLIEQCKQEKHYDVALIHLRLFVSEAYLFTATTRELGFELGFRKYFKKQNMSLVNTSPSADPIEKPLIKPNLIDNLSKLVSTYCELKSAAVKDRDPKLVTVNFVDSFKKKCEMLGKHDNNVNQGRNVTSPNKNESLDLELEEDEEEDFDNFDFTERAFQKLKGSRKKAGTRDQNDAGGSENPDSTEPTSTQPMGGKRKRRFKNKRQTQSLASKKKEEAARRKLEEINSPPPKKKRRILKQWTSAKRKAGTLMAMRGLDFNPGPSTSASSFNDLALPEL